MKDYSTKTCNIEAIVWTGENFKQIEDFIGLGFPGIHYTGGDNPPKLITNYRIYPIHKGDYVIKYIDNSVSVIDSKAFNEIFEAD